MTRLPEQGRLAVEDSLFDRLRAASPDLPVLQATKSTLAASSHLIEMLVEEHAERCVLVSGFQYGRHWAAERDRYLELAGDNDVIAVFAGREPPFGSGVDHVGLRLRTDDPLAQEWFVLALGPGLSITLCGLDGDAHVLDETPTPTLEADRLFDVVWSVQPEVAQLARQVVVEAVTRTGGPQGERIAARLAEMASLRSPTPAEAARAADLLLAGMVERMERVRLREKRGMAVATEHKNNFLSRMSHELRTPLNAILGFGQLLQIGLTDEDSRESVDQILAAGQHLVTLVDELLDIGRIEAGELHLQPTVVPLREVVGDVLGMLQPLAESRSLTVTDETADDACLVLADRDRLRQVLVNLVSNAVKYNRQGGVLAVSCSRTRDAARLSVRDTGQGMSIADLERLFRPFERLDASSRGISGTGLGLVVTRQLVEAMGGHLEVDSRVGFGTTFTLALPYPT